MNVDRLYIKLKIRYHLKKRPGCTAFTRDLWTHFKGVVPRKMFNDVLDECCLEGTLMRSYNRSVVQWCDEALCLIETGFEVLHG
jgi:hypothetical protein